MIETTLPDGARLTRVVSVAVPSPRMRRIVLGGEGLDGFALPATCWAPYVKLIFPRPDAMPARRTYSVRAFDAGRRELTIDMLLHEPRGIGSRWASEARPGDALAILGPGIIDVPPAPDWVLLAGDHCALPAIAFTLERLPASARGLALLALDHPDDRQPLVAPPGVDVRWLGGDLAEAVAAAPWPRDGTGVLWAGAEAAAARRIRAHARQHRGLDQSFRPILNYWKRGQAEGSFGFLA